MVRRSVGGPTIRILRPRPVPSSGGRFFAWAPELRRSSEQRPPFPADPARRMYPRGMGFPSPTPAPRDSLSVPGPYAVRKPHEAPRRGWAAGWESMWETGEEGDAKTPGRALGGSSAGGGGGIDPTEGVNPHTLSSSADCGPGQCAAVRRLCGCGTTKPRRARTRQIVETAGTWASAGSRSRWTRIVSAPASRPVPVRLLRSRMIRSSSSRAGRLGAGEVSTMSWDQTLPPLQGKPQVRGPFCLRRGLLLAHPCEASRKSGSRPVGTVTATVVPGPSGSWSGTTPSRPTATPRSAPGWSPISKSSSPAPTSGPPGVATRWSGP